ncbi:MAG: hypothetical protein OEM50_08525 [Gammaproteobacteria bacterium]|nr:hypothetical protein [Gammaproteobacteria bacterium]MDH3363614.1 hypothetical protein [Gammaproteobacteria bacterium]MDH3481746.1 hypothetical protein [Gammaproteobacteria bacterium]
MTRSPLAYPLNRSADADSGGAADLQTDIMRFMAILSLCLVAIFALVQSIPMTPTTPVPPETQPTPAEAAAAVAKAVPPTPTVARPAEKPVEKTVTLTRPTWVPKHQPARTAAGPLDTAPDVPAPVPIARDSSSPSTPPVERAAEGFTLRFESDAALTRLVAASRVGLYAIESDRAQRMTVSNSRISFWDASVPNTFHEMETATVPAAVSEALARTGTKADAVSWGVTLPGKLKAQLDDLMQTHSGGALIIGASGDIRLEAS